MYKETKNSTLEKIYLYDCWIPEYGKGLNFITGEIADTDIIKCSNNKREQRWIRTELPKDWAKRLKTEQKKQLGDPDYSDPGMDVFRKQEWHRRLHGAWFWNNGVPTFLPAEYYMYLNWWPLDDGYGEYRNADRKRYNVLEYSVQDPLSAGMIDIANRRSGKSYRGALFTYNYPSIVGDSFGGIQSKTDGDARTLFKNKLITPFRRLPEFFRPEIDNRTGTNPEKELRMIKSPRRGKNAMEDISELGLNSFINYLSSEPYSYDGWKLHRYLDDEFAKPTECDVYERWMVVKYCLRVGRRWIGKSLHTSTTEQIEVNEKKKTAGGAEQMWIDSDPRERDENGHTKTGLYKYYTKAQEIFETDEYGNADEAAGYQFYINTRAALQDNTVALEKEIAKNTLDESELFRGKTSDCLYNAFKLGERESFLMMNQGLVERGNFVWSEKPYHSPVLWQKNTNGRWIKRWLPGPQYQNKSEWNGNMCYPMNTSCFVSGADPIDHDLTVEVRNSKASSSVKKRRNFDNDDFTNKMHCCMYLFRPPMAEMYYEDMILQCYFFGCQILVENNKPGLVRHFRRKGFAPFLVHLPGYPEPGVPSTQENKRDASLMADSYIEQHINKMFFIEQVRQAHKFDINKTQKFDAWMGFLWTEYADGYRYFDEEAENSGIIEATELFRQYDLN